VDAVQERKPRKKRRKKPRLKGNKRQHFITILAIAFAGFFQWTCSGPVAVE
jgi:hypothetical protein